MENKKYQARKQRSLQMLQSGVEPIKNGFNEYYIPSQNNTKIKYKVTIKNGWYSCECPDNKKGNLCKHILLLKTFLAIKLKAQNIKKNVSITKPCPYCESHNIMKYGTRKTTLGKKQTWKCKDCSKRFVLEPIQKIKGNIQAVTMAMDLYMRGVSYRGIKEHLEQFLGLKVTHVTIMNWVNTYMKKLNQYTEKLQPQTSREFGIDEQMVNVKGDHKWVWNCLDKETRFLIANNLTKGRSLEETQQIMQKLKKNAKVESNFSITTDKMLSYPHAIGATFHKMNDWKHNFSIEHIQCGIKDEINNNKVERFHGSFRQRDKVMRAFKKDETTDKYIDNFRTYYNFIREHQALNGKTPAQRAGINEGRNWKELLVKSL